MVYIFHSRQDDWPSQRCLKAARAQRQRGALASQTDEMADVSDTDADGTIWTKFWGDLSDHKRNLWGRMHG